MYAGKAGAYPRVEHLFRRKKKVLRPRHLVRKNDLSVESQGAHRDRVPSSGRRRVSVSGQPAAFPGRRGCFRLRHDAGVVVVKERRRRRVPA